jgi:hypothetical protein
VAADILPPSVSATLNPAVPNGDNGWYTSDVSATLASADDGAGAVTVEYRLDGATAWSTWTPLSSAIVVTAQGGHTLEYRATDAAGKLSAVQSVAFTIDRTAPTSTARITTDAAAAAINTATVELSATDTPSGVAVTRYAIDGGDWVDYTGAAVTVEGAGDHSLAYRSTDKAGNLEATRTVAVAIADRIAPVATLRLPEANAAGWLGAGASATLSATDAGSAVRSIEYRYGDGTWETYSGAVSLPDGRYAFAFRATDEAGNVSAAAQRLLSVDATAPKVWGWLSADRTVTAAVSDATSGVDRVEYSLTGSSWVSSLEALMSVNATPDEAWIRATDHAGNVSEPMHLVPGDAPTRLEVAPGEALRIEAGGFTAADTVRVELQSSSVVLGTAIAGAHGSISLNAVVPATLEPGEHTLVFIVVADAGPGAGGGAGAVPVTVIANTGLDLGPLSWTALALLLCGLGVGFARRRRAVKHPAHS